MENRKNMQENFQNMVPGGHIDSIFIRNLRKLVYVAGLTAIGLFLNSCRAGYVETEPVYVEHVRPNRPTETHIWVDDNWSWNNQRHVYVQKTGYWEKPRHGRSYVSGYWQTSPNGKTWSKGHWQKEGQKGGRNKR
jgi:hypothetical protein